MQRLRIPLSIFIALACSGSTGSRASERAQPAAPIADSPRIGHADVDLTGIWTTGSTGEPGTKQLVLHPQCNYGPRHWIIEQSGDTVRVWNIPERQAQGVATRESASSTPAEGWVSGVDLFIGTSGAHYLLHYDSTSGHLRGTLNGSPFWAARLEIVRPKQCLPVP